MMSPTRTTAGAGKISGAYRWANRETRSPAPIGPGPVDRRAANGLVRLRLGLVQELLELLVRLGDHRVGPGALDRLLDGDADDVPVLRDVHDLRKSRPADLDALLVGRVPLERHLRPGFDLGEAPGRRAAHADAAQQLAVAVLLAGGPLAEEVGGLLVPALGAERHRVRERRREVACRTRGQHRVPDLPHDLRSGRVLELVGEVYPVDVHPDLALHERGAALVPVE